MLLEYWQGRWQRNEIGFHQDTVNPYLVRHWERLGVKPPGRVFVPMCGKSVDMYWLYSRGYPVLGVEISALAVQAFFDDAGLEAQPVTEAGLPGWAHDELKILCADYFELHAQHTAGVSAVYDRASLIALPEEMRGRYADHMMMLTHPRAAMLLITLEYPEDEMEGPPFSVRAAEIRRLYGEKYDIELLETAPILEESPRFKEKGLSRLDEAVYLLKPRA